jgi:hypothetical protein
MAITAPETLTENPQNSSEKSHQRDLEATLYKADNGSFPGHLGEFCVGVLEADNAWRPEPESNRRARICSPLRHHSAIGPRYDKK